MLLSMLIILQYSDYDVHPKHCEAALVDVGCDCLDRSDIQYVLNIDIFNQLEKLLYSNSMTRTLTITHFGNQNSHFKINSLCLFVL